VGSISAPLCMVNGRGWLKVWYRFN
jgi:hypothetical protein